MFKSFSLLTLALITLSCGEIEPQGTRSEDPFSCETDCTKDTKWTINYSAINIPNNITLKLYGKTYLDECIGSENYPFEISGKTTNGITITSSLFYPAPQSYVDIEIYNCDTNTIFFKNPSATYTSSLKNILISL